MVSSLFLILNFASFAQILGCVLVFTPHNVSQKVSLFDPLITDNWNASNNIEYHF